MKEVLAVAAFLSGLCVFALTVAADRELRAMVRDRAPAITQAGIKTVDWWVGCLRGVFLLAFSSAGTSLSKAKRRLFQALVVSYVVAALVIPTYNYVRSIG